MSLEIYSKEPIVVSEQKNRKFDKYFYVFISVVGLIAIIFAAWPFFIWQFKTAPKFSSQVKSAPVPESRILSASTKFTQDVQVVEDPDGFTFFTTTNKVEKRRTEQFSITIPKLNIKNAITNVDSLDFRNNLSHFPGTGLPGEIGNSFITGHSVLPQFNNPKDYNTIFTKLTDLEIGDKINVTSEGKQYQYIVQYSKVVDPHDLSVLNPISENGKNLTLMTCVPPGTNIKRLVVVTSLI